MRKNVIILTAGLSGSSVLASLISTAGYWVGDNTFRKADYDTYENEDLIQLNLRLFQEAGYKGDYTTSFSQEVLERIASGYEQFTHSPYLAFLAKCNDHRPWLWKDPRLWLTIRFWKHLLNLEDCNFVLLTRDPLQSWISANIRRQIQSYRYVKYYNDRVNESIKNFLSDNSLPHLHLQYEELVLGPDAAIAKLNGYLSTHLGVEDLQAVYNKPLYKNPRSFWDLLKAGSIYVKNYSRRLDR